MSELARFQTQWLWALKNPKAKLSQDLEAQLGAYINRIDIYRTTYLETLIDLLKCRYSWSFKLLGEDSFAAFAHDYVNQYALESGNRDLYGAHFGDFLAQHERAQGLGYVADMARLEWAQAHAHHARDATTVGFEALLSSEVTLHPSAQIVKLGYNVFAMSHWLDSGAVDEFALQSQCETRLIWRAHDDSVQSLCLDEDQAALIEALRRGVSLGTYLVSLADKALHEIDLDALQTFLAKIVPQGVFTTK